MGRRTATARHPALFRALAPATGGMVTALRAWAHDNNVDPEAMEAAIRFRREHAMNLADTQVQRIAVLLERYGDGRATPVCPHCGQDIEPDRPFVEETR